MLIYFYIIIVICTQKMKYLCNWVFLTKRLPEYIRNCVCWCACVQKSVLGSCLKLSPAYFLSQGLSFSLKFADLARLPGQQAPGLLPGLGLQVLPTIPALLGARISLGSCSFIYWYAVPGDIPHIYNPRTWEKSLVWRLTWATEGDLIWINIYSNIIQIFIKNK